MGKKKALRYGILAATTGATALLLLADRSGNAPGAEAPRAAKAEPHAQPAPFTLPSREGLKGAGRDIFALNLEPARPAAPKKRPALKPEVAAAPAAPVAPPVPYRVAGQVVHEGPPQVVLMRDERVYLAREGEALDGGYRVESIKAEGVTLVYIPLEHRHFLAAASNLEVLSAPQVQQAAKPVQLRWEGPAQVQAGSEFEVALKMTSHLPVRGSPLQLSYDAKLLEPVSVRAGGFFLGGKFTYRVNPGGSIFVGAFGKGEVPADAEFLVVTFKPIRPGAIAELRLSSLVLQGMTGGTLAHEPPAAFRTSITQ